LLDSNERFKHLLVKSRGGRTETRKRLIAAASELFAERGFHATTARDIARRAGVNLAAGHYHYGSKKDLYLEVLQAQFAEIWTTLARRGGTRPLAEIDRLGRRELVALLSTRLQVMLDLLIGTRPVLHGALMQREMTDPSQALPMIVGEFIDPMMRETERIVARLEPRLRRRDVERCAVSIIGQAVFYRFAMPAFLHRQGWKRYPRGFSREVAAYVATFSLGGMAAVAAARREKAHAAE
jgi:TetR/AcrR family transcriptional regulator, regulator of cefoperazone and chloramphenicol sensitivity